ncbi:MAG: metallophosphoesterase [Planctomycetes bacterium]|nr:metallophosphoesterase [Planctomycetota bacterium]
MKLSRSQLLASVGAVVAIAALSFAAGRSTKRARVVRVEPTVLPTYSTEVATGTPTSAARDAADSELFEPFLIKPYLTETDRERVTVNWRLKQAGRSRIEWGTSFDYEAGALEFEESEQHKAEITGLRPDTTYHYCVNNAFRGEWRTDRDGTVRFAVVGHTHGSERFGHYPDEWLVARLVDLHPDFVVHTGDITYFNIVDDFRRYFFQLFEPLIDHVPIYVSPGNHDTGWPFIDGLDTRPFRHLFPYPYPEDVITTRDEAHYAIQKGGLQLIFLSYTSPLGPKSAARAFVEERLADNTNDFNVLVFGGANEYYNRTNLYEWMKDLPIDAVFNGDGSQKHNEPVVNAFGTPVFFVGTADDQPHPLLYVEYDPEILSLSLLDSAGAASDLHWIHTQREVEPIAFLGQTEDPILYESRINIPLTLDAPIRSTDIHGLRLRFEANSSTQLTAYAFLEPVGRTQGEPGFRTRYAFVSNDEDMLSLATPQARPNSGKAFDVQRVILVISGYHEKGDFELREAFLY